MKILTPRKKPKRQIGIIVRNSGGLQYLAGTEKKEMKKKGAAIGKKALGGVNMSKSSEV